MPFDPVPQSSESEEYSTSRGQSCSRVTDQVVEEFITRSFSQQNSAIAST